MPPLERYGIKLAILNISFGEGTNMSFVSMGSSPQCRAGIISDCRFDPVLPNFLIVDSPAGLK